MHERSRFPEPSVFRPERFLVNGDAPQELENSSDKNDAKTVRKIIFGFGRR